MGRQADDGSFLEGQLLIAMPAMGDPRFAKAVIYLCAHSPEGAMGLILNQKLPNLSFPQLLAQLDIVSDEAQDELPPDLHDMPVQVGGPVETARGFVLHSPDYVLEKSTLVMPDGICLTATLDILKAIAAGKGPRRSLLMLGYSGWGAGQLESEIQANGWLHCAADPSLVLSGDMESRYERSLAKLGIDPGFLAHEAGHA